MTIHDRIRLTASFPLLGDQKLRWRFYLLEFSIYIPLAFFTFIGNYFNQLHFSDFQNGLIGSSSAIVLLLSNPFWMHFADKRVKNGVLTFLAFASATLIWSVYAFKTFWFVLPIVFTVGFLWTSIVPLAESISTVHSEEQGFSFGKARMMGSIGFAAAILIMGYVKSNTLFFLIGSISFALIGVVSFFIPKTKGFNVGKEMHFSFGNLPAPFYRMLVLETLVLSSNAFGLYFLPILMRARGYSVSFAGVATAIQALVEIPFLFFADRIVKFLGVKRLLVIASVGFGIRWILTGAFDNLILMVAVQAFEFFNWIAIYYAILHYVNFNIKPSLRSNAQTIFWMTTSGFSMIFGLIMGGWMANTFGVKNGYLFFGIMSISTAVFYGIFEHSTDVAAEKR